MYSLRLEGTDRLRAALDPAKFQKTMVSALTKSAAKVQKHAVQNLKDGSSVARVRGGLMQSVASIVDASRLIARVGTNLVYGPVHEYGATIRPKRGKFLVFPMPVNEARQNVRGTRLAKGWQKTMKWRRRASLGKGMGGVTISGDVVMVFAKKVTIPPRPWLGPALRDESAHIIETFRETLERSLRQ